MPHRDTIGSWIENLPSEAVELRVRAGHHKDRLEGIGSMKLEGGGIGKRALELVDGAECGGIFRCGVHDQRGKVLTTRLFHDGTEASDHGGSIDARLSAPVASTEDALWRIVLELRHVLERMATSNETLVKAAAEPLQAMSHLFKSEHERRADAEVELLGQMRDYYEMQNVSEQALQALQNGEQPDELRGMAAGMVRGIAAAFGVELGDDPAPAAAEPAAP